MFTGVITSMGQVLGVSRARGSIVVRVGKPAGWKIKLGESVSVDGICSTVKQLRGGAFEVEYMPETINKTTAGLFDKGDEVNLERPLRLRDRLDGHLVQGHVDAMGEILEAKKVGESVVLKIGFPGRYAKFIAEKGSICVNGVSLTVVAVKKNEGKNWFSVSLVSYTLQHTNLRNLKKGDKVNLEVDMLARYLDALQK